MKTATLSSIWPPIFTLEDVQLQLLLLGWQEKPQTHSHIYNWEKIPHMAQINQDPNIDEDAIVFFQNWKGTWDSDRAIIKFDNYFQLIRHITNDSRNVVNDPE